MLKHPLASSVYVVMKMYQIYQIWIKLNRIVKKEDAQRGQT